jgi:hypothetical protein
MDMLLYPAFGIVVLGVCILAIRDRTHWLRHNKLLMTLLIWAAGYFGFLAYHDNIQPRYYLVIAVPMMMVVAIAAGQCLRWLLAAGRLSAWGGWRWSVAASAAVLLLAAVGSDARLLLHFVRTPQYSFLDAALQVQEIINADPGRNHMLMSISGNDITLMTGVPSICDDFGTMELEERIAAYRPGWYVTWNQVEDDKQEALDKFYRLERVAEIPALDDPDRNLLIVYKLLPRDGFGIGPLHHHRRRPRLLQTGFEVPGPESMGASRVGTDPTTPVPPVAVGPAIVLQPQDAAPVAVLPSAKD